MAYEQNIYLVLESHYVAGITKEGCGKIERLLSRMVGVTHVDCSIVAQSVTVTYHPTIISPPELASAIQVVRIYCFHRSHSIVKFVNPNLFYIPPH